MVQTALLLSRLEFAFTLSFLTVFPSFAKQQRRRHRDKDKKYPFPGNRS